MEKLKDIKLNKELLNIEPKKKFYMMPSFYKEHH